MKATILAAGVGSRLRPLTDSVPKCLVSVAGRPVLGWQIDALMDAGVERIVVVAGYRAPQVVEFCRPFGDAVSVVVNERYDQTNNMFSLRLALRGSEQTGTLICNGDVVFDPAIVLSVAGARERNTIAVERGRYIEESMKVCVGADGRVSALSKAIARDDAYGVSIDLYSFDADAVSALCRTADRMIDQEGQVNLWTEVAIESILKEVFVHPFDIEGRRWIEIDNFDDLAEGERLFSVPTP